jgi:branched-subunit amino acid aminotransferase/4-amino-4-deoxychorismate lyase
MKTYHLTPNGARELPLAAASLDEISRLLPQGLYTTFRTYIGGTKVLGLQAHLNRLYQPAATQNIAPQASEGELRHFLAQTCSAMDTESRVRLTLGVSDQAGAVFVTIQPFTPLAPKSTSTACASSARKRPAAVRA